MVARQFIISITLLYATIINIWKQRIQSCENSHKSVVDRQLKMKPMCLGDFVEPNRYPCVRVNPTEVLFLVNVSFIEAYSSLKLRERRDEIESLVMSSMDSQHLWTVMLKSILCNSTSGLQIFVYLILSMVETFNSKTDLSHNIEQSVEKFWETIFGKTE